MFDSTDIIARRQYDAVVELFEKYVLVDKKTKLFVFYIFYTNNVF